MVPCKARVENVFDRASRCRSFNSLDYGLFVAAFGLCWCIGSTKEVGTAQVDSNRVDLLFSSCFGSLFFQSTGSSISRDRGDEKYWIRSFQQQKQKRKSLLSVIHGN